MHLRTKTRKTYVFRVDHFNESSFIQTVLSVPESHRISVSQGHAMPYARGLYRRSGISPCPEDLFICSYSIADIREKATPFLERIFVVYCIQEMEVQGY